MSREDADHYIISSKLINLEFILILKQLFIDRSWIDINTGVFLREVCSDPYKNHGCRQKIPEGTSSAMFDVPTRHWQMLRIQAMYFDSIRCYPSYASYHAPINTGVFLGKMCSDRCKNHGCGQKKIEGTSSSRFGLRTAAKCGELKRCADRVRSRTDNLR